MRTEFNSRETSAKMESDERKALSRRVASEVDESSRSSSSYYKSNASHLTGTAGEQVVIKREQEVVLGKLDAGLSTLKEMARTIDDELEGQNKLLESIDNETDKAQGSMDQAIKSIEKLLGTSNSCQLCTILSLVVVFVIGECPYPLPLCAFFYALVNPTYLLTFFSPPFTPLFPSSAVTAVAFMP
jgi:t-SNARE complex subunit (syntaxin)